MSIEDNQTNMPIKVLHILFDLDIGGVETMLYNYYLNINMKKIRFDFLIHSGSNKVGFIEQKVINMGSNVYRVTPVTKNFLKSSKEIVKVVIRNDYDVIHAHTKFFSCVPLIAAKIKKNKLKISHSHSLGSKRNWLYNVFSYCFRKLTASFSDYRFACSENAGINLFGEKYTFDILPNAINCDNFMYDLQVREKERRSLNLNGKFVIGLIGRHDPIKNHLFALEIFKFVNSQNKYTKLIFIGKQQEKFTPKINNKIKQLNLEESVLVMEPRYDIYNFYQALDLLLLPSKSEGLGIVLIEAQVSGLRSLCSDMVPSEVKITPLVEFISLKCGAEFWGKKVLKYMEDTKFERRSHINEISLYGYDIKISAKKLEKFYMDSMKRKSSYKN